MGDDSGELVDKFHKWTEKVVKRLKLTFNGQELKPFLDKKYYESSFNQKEKKILSDVIQTENLSVNSAMKVNVVENAEKTDSVAEPELEVFNEKIPNKARKIKFQKNVSTGGKISKANAFQIQQRIVKNEAKVPIAGSVSTVISDVRASSNGSNGCCGGNSKDKNKVEKEGGAGGSCCSSNQVRVSVRN